MAITISGSGITSANIADGTIVNADVADVAASKLTGALPAIDGSSLTNLPGGGKVLQVVQSSTNSQVTIATTSYTDSGLSASITPSSTTSKILVIVNQLVMVRGNSRSRGYGFQILRDATVALNTDNGSRYGSMYRDINVGSITGIETNLPTNTTWLDSPSTTSAVTYKTQLAINSTSDGGQLTTQGYGGKSIITLMEIGV